MQQNPVSGSKAPVDSRCLANKIAVGCVQILIHKLMVWNARARERQHPTKTFTCSIVHSQFNAGKEATNRHDNAMCCTLYRRLQQPKLGRWQSTQIFDEAPSGFYQWQLFCSAWQSNSP